MAKVRQDTGGPASRCLRTVCSFALAMTGVSAGALAGSAESAIALPTYTQVDNSTMFNEGLYLNQTGNFTNFSLSDFKTSGGSVKRVSKANSMSKDGGPQSNIYEQSQIWPELVGHGADDGTEAWAFVANETVNDTGYGACGGWIEMTYRNIDTIESASDDTFEPIMADCKVKYAVRATMNTSIKPVSAINPKYCFDGHPVIQFSNWFSNGTFQFGVTAMDCSYTFLDSNTGALIPLDSMYYTKTSMDKGEGFFIDADMIKPTAKNSGVYVSNNAHPTKTFAHLSDNSRWNCIQGTYLYDHTHSPFQTGNSIGFSGTPWILETGDDPVHGTKYDYVDSVGDYTYYWRSAAVLVDMHDKPTFDITVTAIGSQDWTSSFDKPDNVYEENYSTMFQTANFIPITNPRAKTPVKTINNSTDTVKEVRIGDTVHYEIAQKVANMRMNSVTNYQSMAYADELPKYVRYKDATAKMLDPFGNDVTTSAGILSYDEDENVLRYSFSDDYLKAGMIYKGGNYTLAFDVEVVDQPEEDYDRPLADNNGDGLYTDGTQGRPDDQGGAGIKGRVPNKASVTINEYEQTTNIVYYEPVLPELSIEKHADLTERSISAVNDYQYLSSDEGNPHAKVHFEGALKNITDKTLAKNVTVSDTLPAGLALEVGSVKFENFEGSERITAHQTTEGWMASIPNLKDWMEVRFSYDCVTKDTGCGSEVINTVHAWATNAKLGTMGGENSHAIDDGEIYINDPNIVLDKSVSESPIQNDDYQATSENDREEYRVGDDISYTVTMKNDTPGTYAHDVWLVDEEMPREFELASDIVVTGIDYNDQDKSFTAPMQGSCDMAKYPYTGNTKSGVNSDGVHGETKTVTSNFSLSRQDYSDGNWGWALHADYLPFGQTITVNWTVKAMQASNGWEVFNRAYAVAKNQPRDTFLSPEPAVWINTPEFDIDKRVTKTKNTYNVGDNAKYQIELKGLKTPGTLARKTTLQDILKTDGVEINELSAIKVYDQRKNSSSIADKVNLYACDDPTRPIEGEDREIQAWHQGKRLRFDDGTDQCFHIDMTQVYEDETGYWVSDPDYRLMWKRGALSRIDGERNPACVDGKSDHDGSAGHTAVWDKTTHELSNYSYLRVEYEATINDDALENTLIDNDATANSIEEFPVTDRASVTIIGAQLDINKNSNDGGSFTVGDVADYELTIVNDSKDTTARDVQIADAFTTAKAGTVEIVDGSVELVDNHGIPLSWWTISYVDNESGNHIGFAIDTNHDLEGNQKLTVRYKVKYLSDNGSSYIENTARTWAENAPEVQDEYQTWPKDADQSLLTIAKGSDKQNYESGDTGIYTLHVANDSNETVTNVTIHDELDSASLAIASIIRGSISIKDDDGEVIGGTLTYLQSSSGKPSGFFVETGRDLEPGEALDVTYRVSFDADGQSLPDGATIAHNAAWAAGDNSGKATDENEVSVGAGGDNELTTQSASDPDPKIEKQVDREQVTPGSTVHYTITITAGTEPLTDTIVEDVMDPMLEIDEASIRTYGPEGQYDSEHPRINPYQEERADGSKNEGNEEGEWKTYEEEIGKEAPLFYLGIVEAGESVSVEYDCTVSSEAALGNDLVNTATLMADGIDPVSDDATVTPMFDSPLRNALSAGGLFGKTGDAAINALVFAAILGAITAATTLWLRRGTRRRHE